MPTDLLSKIFNVEIKFGIKIGDVKKSATILRAAKRDYAQVVMTITSTITKAAHKRRATPKEMVVAMQKQWRVQGNRESANKKVEDNWHETAIKEIKKKSGIKQDVRYWSPHGKTTQI